MLFNDWVSFFEHRLTLSSKPYKEAIVTVLSRIDMQCPILLKKDRLNSDMAISSQSKALSLEAQTRVELEITSFILDGLYEFHVKARETLIVPKARVPLPPEKPMFNTSQLPIAMVETLVDRLHRQVNHHPKIENFHHQARRSLEPAMHIGHALLLIAFHTDLTNISELNELVEVCSDTSTAIHTLSFVSVYLPKCHRRVYLSDAALLAWHALLPYCEQATALTENRRKQWIKKSLRSWLMNVCGSLIKEESNGLLDIGESEVLKNIGILRHSIGLQALWRHNHSLDDVSFIRAMTGNIVQHRDHEKEALSHHSRGSHGAKRVSYEGITDNEIKDPDIKTSISYQEAQIHIRLSHILKEYQHNDIKQSRKSRAFFDAKQQLIELSPLSLSWRNTLLINWITSLFINGSAWKKKLAVGTLLTYHSRIKTFMKCAWFDLSVLESDLDIFTQACQVGLDHFEDANGQYTVARFLRYCLQYQGFPSIDLDIFDLVTTNGEVRVNYLPPSMFDECCQSFINGKGVLERSVLVFMNLCYYAGLREDEALNLKCRDIYYDTGMLYITDEKKRKTPHAVRKIPLFLLPDHAVTLLIEFTDTQSKLKGAQSHLFQSWLEAGGKTVFQQLEDQFIHHCRRHCQDSRIVTHTFRHCAANNWMILLSMIIFELPKGKEPFFLKHALFSLEKRTQVQEHFVSQGYPLSYYFKISDWISEKLGHSSPSTMFSVYLHLVDWLAWQISFTNIPIQKSLVVQWASDSNYGYELVKSLTEPYDQHTDKVLVLAGSVTRFVQRKLPNKRCFDVLEPNDWQLINSAKKNGLTFSDFVYQLAWLQQGINNSDVDVSLVTWCEQSSYIPERINIKPNQHASWLRLIQHLDDISSHHPQKFIRLSTQAQKFSRYFVEEKAISKRVDLLSVLAFYRRLGISGFTVKLTTDDPYSLMAQSWQSRIEKQKLSVHWALTKDKCLEASLRPYQYRWPLWDRFFEITRYIQAYNSYLLANQSIRTVDKEGLDNLDTVYHTEAEQGML